MAVPVPLRSTSKLDAQVKTEEMVSHTIHIMSNPKVFDPKYHALAERVIDCAVATGQDIWEANGIRVGNDPMLWRERRRLQARACRGFDTLLYLVSLCRKVYHLRNRKYEAWVKKVGDAKELARKWRDSDARRFRHLDSGK